MALRLALNGFGRIGRLALRALLEQALEKAGDRAGKVADEQLEVVAINDLGSLKSNAYLMKYDSVHGRFPGTVEEKEGRLVTDLGSIQIFQEPDPQKLPWKDLDIDLVLECSGHFTNGAKASLHLKAGAKRELISAPGDDVDFTVVYGINQDQLLPSHRLVSNGSCTTNCLVPVAFVLQKALGIEAGYMTTIHAYTGDQRLVDTLHSDLRRARAATLSMIPTSTGAAKAVALVLPELAGKLDGTAIRVPTANVSLVDFTFTASRETSVQEINQWMKVAAEGELKGVLSVCEEPLVSVDFVHNPASSIFDLTQTQVVAGKFCRVLSWYDNEWGFANRLLDVARLMGSQGM